MRSYLLWSARYRPEGWWKLESASVRGLHTYHRWDANPKVSGTPIWGSEGSYWDRLIMVLHDGFGGACCHVLCQCFHQCEDESWWHRLRWHDSVTLNLHFRVWSGHFGWRKLSVREILRAYLSWQTRVICFLDVRCFIELDCDLTSSLQITP